MTKYGKVSDKNRKYFKHLRRDFDVNERVRVTTGVYRDEEGTVVMIDDATIYVDFEKGGPAESFPAWELERCE